MSEREMIAPSQSLSLLVLQKSALAGACIGALQGFVGYAPRVNVVLMTISAAAVGTVVAAVLGVSLYLFAFRTHPVMAALQAVALVAGTGGILASLFLRWWTGGEGAVFSMFVTPALAVVTAAAVKAYIFFERTPALVAHH